VTLVTVAGVKIIGAVLVGALLVIPAAAARILARSLAGYVMLSVAIASVATLAGIFLPMQFDLPVPSGPAVILIAGTIFLICAALRGLKGASA
ncbi:metal ABC transporter permease, partial [Rhodovulum sulfidophilum]|nr:metal ABC transporter permease [Rhodovulum sulfidophilum]